MPKRGENIRKRKDGRWEGRYKTGRDAEGRIIYKSVYGKTYAKAKDNLTSTLQTNAHIECQKKNNYTLEKVLLLWLDINHIKFKGATENKYEYLIQKHIIPELGHIPVSDLTIFTINSFMVNKLQAGRLDGGGGLSSSYVRSIMLIVNSALEFAANEKMREPLNTPICKPSVEKKEFPILSIDEQKKFESLLFSEPDQTKIGILISLHTGLRIGEVCALTWDDINFKDRAIRVRSTVTRIKNKSADIPLETLLVVDTPKTRASLRNIPISSALLPVLRDMKKRSCSNYVVSENPSFVSPRTYEYRYHKLLDHCGIKSVNYHALRHTFATRCIEVGVDVKSLSEILGHANVSITLNTYVHSSMDLKRKQIEKLNALLA